MEGSSEEDFPEERQKSAGKVSVVGKIRENPWILTTLVFGLLSIILIIGNFSGGITGKVISANDAGEKLLDFYTSGGGVEGLALNSVDEVSGLYKVNFDYQGAIVPIYVTKDGNYAGSLSVLNNPAPGSTDSSKGSDVADVSIGDDAIKGDSNAPVTIIEFSDYECPFCGRYFEQTLPKIISEYVNTGKVRLVFRDFPLNFHKSAQKAAEAAECAGEQGKYWEMHDKLFKNQDKLDVDSLKQYAKDLGLNLNNFNKCLDSGEMADEVQKDIEDGQKAGVSGTPAFFINGRFVSGAQPFSTFQEIIEEELARLNL